MKRIILFTLLIIGGLTASAQIQYPYVLTASSDPTGNACTGSPQLQVYQAGNKVDFCGSGNTYVALSSGGGGGVTSITGDGTIISNSASTGAVTLTLANTVTGTGGVVLANNPVLSGNGAASTAALALTGTINSGGTGTTNFPQILIQPTGTTAVTAWGTSGTAIGVNVSSLSKFLDFWASGTVEEFNIDNSGNVKFNASVGGFGNTVGLANTGYGGVGVASNTGITFSSTTNWTGTKDSGFDRAAAGVIEANLGTASGNGGSVRAASFQAGGTTFTVSGCGTAGSVTGGASAGSFTVGTGASNCAFTVTINGATGLTAAHGWIANADDTTAAIHCLNSATVSATTVLFTCPGSIATNDVIKFSAMAY